MSKLMMISLSLSLAACMSSATSRPNLDHTLPSVDRLGMRTELLGADPKIFLRLCTDRDGKVASVDIEHSSELGTFDQAVLNDVAQWQFAPQAAPSCQKIVVRYNPQA
jgi:TonB family protein